MRVGLNNFSEDEQVGERPTGVQAADSFTEQWRSGKNLQLPQSRFRLQAE